MAAAKSIEGKTTTLSGWEQCQVGEGARTIELSPSGRFVFAACNLASKLFVVDTRTMKTVANIDVDSYPVGLDISNDGRFVIVTSQGRENKGGNAVNIYEVEYAEPEPVLKNSDGAALIEALENPGGDATAMAENENNGIATYLDGGNAGWLAMGGGVLLVVVAGLLIRRRLHHAKS